MKRVPDNILSIPFVAVWMVAYNHERYVRQAIESVMTQETSFSYRLFIGDDCSTDKTREICLELKDKYQDKIALCLNERNLGSHMNAMNIYKACINSRATYIGMLEGDDYWVAKDKLQKQVDFLENNSSYNASFHNVTILDDVTETKQKVYLTGRKKSIGLEDLANGDYMKTCSVLFRNIPDVFTPMLDGRIPCLDTTVGYCILSDGKKAAYFDEPMAVYRKHEGGIWGKIDHEKRIVTSISYLRQYRKFYHDKILRPQLDRQLKLCGRQLFRISVKKKKLSQAIKSIGIYLFG